MAVRRRVEVSVNNESPRVSVRVPPPLLLSLEAVVAARDMNKSEWVQEAFLGWLEVDRAARSAGMSPVVWFGEVLQPIMDAQVRGPRTLGMEIQQRVCVHPLSGRETRTFDVYCRVCQTVLRRLT